MVAESTRKAVEEAARTTGYQVNLVARSLRTQRSQTVLVLVPGIDNQLYPDILRGLEEHAHTEDYSIILGLTGKDRAREEAYLDILHSRRADGLVIVDDGIRHVIDGGIIADVPTVQLMETQCGSSVAAVRIDDKAAAVTAVRHLAELGHRRIAHVTGRPGSIVAARRIDGYRAAVKQFGADDDPALLVEGQYNFESGAAAAGRLLTLTQPPTAIFCANDASALGALRCCGQLGWRVPRDVSVIGIDDIADSGMAEPPLTTIRQPRHAFGTTAMSLVLDLIKGRTGVPKDVVLPFELVVRGSTAPPVYS